MSCFAMKGITAATEVSADGVMMLLEGIRQLGLAIQELRELRDLHGTAHTVDYVVQNAAGDKLGVVKRENTVELFTAEPQKESVKETVRSIRQVYARLQVLNMANQKGYSQVKEEKLMDGSIRLVVQKWR